MARNTLCHATALCAWAVLLSGCATGQAAPAMRDVGGDLLISDDIRLALQTDGVFDDDDILIETFHGTVLLRGLVDFGWQRSRAADLATDTDGVNHVRNELIDLDRECRDASVSQLGLLP